MKTPPHPSLRRRVRIKPGRFIKLPPYILDRAGWNLGDILFVTAAGDGINFARLPTEVAWRVDRLRLRTGSTARVASASPMIRNYADHLRLQRCKDGRARRTDNQSERVKVAD